LGKRTVGEKEKAQIIYELRREFKITELVKIADIPRSTYYYHVKQMNKPEKHKDVKERISSIYHENKGRYGYRRITLALRNEGRLINHKRVQRLMNELGIFSKVRMHKYYSYKGEVGKIAPNLLERKFSADKPNQKWVTDITEFALFGQKLYLSPILDLYNGEIVSYNISSSPNYRQIEDMLSKAFVKLPDNTNLIFHSDQGWQYQMKKYQRALRAKGIRQSMSRKGNCLDNAVMEGFFGHLKSELLYLQEFNSLEHFTAELTEYLDYYNNRRIKEKLKGMSPVEYKIRHGFAA